MFASLKLSLKLINFVCNFVLVLNPMISIARVLQGELEVWLLWETSSLSVSVGSLVPALLKLELLQVTPRSA